MGEQLSMLDTMFLELEQADESAHMHIGAALLFEPLPGGGTPEIAEFRDHMRARVGILPRFAALVLGLDMLGAILTAGRIDGGPHLILPPLLGVLCLIIVIAGGGRWALVDRIDPAPPRRLLRTR